ncbi:hypothetical protein D3C87_1749780 [compost metagenome]
MFNSRLPLFEIPSLFIFSWSVGRYITEHWRARWKPILEPAGILLAIGEDVADQQYMCLALVIVYHVRKRD